jgi:hypothetical protein
MLGMINGNVISELLIADIPYRIARTLGPIKPARPPKGIFLTSCRTTGTRPPAE